MTALSGSKEPVKDPFIGLDFIYDCLFAKPADEYLGLLHEAFRALGPTYVSRRWTWETVYTRDEHNIKHVLATAFDDFQLPELRISAMAGLLGSGIFTLNGHSWATARGVLRGALAKQDRDASMEKLERYFQALLRRVVPHQAQKDQTQDQKQDQDQDQDQGPAVEVDLQPLFFWLAMDFATDLLMGRSTNTLEEGDSRGCGREEQFVQDYLTCSSEIVHKMRLGPLQFLSLNGAARRARRRIFRYIDGFIEESLRDQGEGVSGEGEMAEMGGRGGRGRGRGPGGGGGRGRTVLSELAAITEDRKQLRDQILHILVAGRDTTACLLSNLFFVLARKPETYAKLRREVFSIAGEKPPTAKMLHQMQYLKWCVQESLRLHPVIPTNARQAVRDTTLPRGGGADGKAPLFVRQGTLVMYNIYAMHRDEAVFGAEPEEFVPERWEGLRPGWSYLPFNGGPRICIGQKFALLETHFIVSRMVQVFEKMEAVDDGPWRELFALATTCRDGVRVRLTTYPGR
ncbi:Cytochrome P450 52A11 [Escovopsis weberi]|uniref:Cytochrome P450 52A11 n=1 Tax=Escovopsis weberi TaxID=150374 RepID=A0A0M9VUL5_ESCWE|nr:Cytochrome P450 52A11 [Escovopsis weberi]